MYALVPRSSQWPSTTIVWSRLGLENRGSGFELQSCVTADRILIEIEVHVGEYGQRVNSREIRDLEEVPLQQAVLGDASPDVPPALGGKLGFDRRLGRYRRNELRTCSSMPLLIRRLLQPAEW